MMKQFALIFVFLALVSATTFFKEEFGEGWESRWVQSEHDSGYGKFVASAGKFFGDEKRDTGLQTSQDAKFYSMSTEINPVFSNKDQDLVIQYTVKHEQKIDCGGGYLKLGPKIDGKTFHGETQYNIMFGPDICGATKRTHLILNYNGENHLRRDDMKCETDELTHLYTLVLHPDQTYEVLIDQKSIASGSLLDDFDFLPPKEIEDPNVSKPEGWVEDSHIPNPDDVKPQGWDDVPQFVSDPDAEKPDDWETDEDGEWEAPSISNPDYKGEWAPEMIENPDYKGPWVHPMIPNPEYKEDDSIYAFEEFGFVGVDIWQVKSGSIFDNIIITNSIEEANAHAEETYVAMKGEERKLYDADKEQKKKEADEERERRDAEIKAMEEESTASDDDDLEEAKPAHDDL